MTRRFSRLLVLGISLFAAPTVLAEETLPKDGTWARYYVLNTDEAGVEKSGHQPIRFVGTVTENGEKLRWIEFVDTTSDESSVGGKPKTNTDVHSFLIPEKALRASTNPIRLFVRGWSSDRGKPRKTN